MTEDREPFHSSNHDTLDGAIADMAVFAEGHFEDQDALDLYLRVTTALNESGLTEDEDIHAGTHKISVFVRDDGSLYVTKELND